MTYNRKTEDEFQIHCDYGYGWEEVCCETTAKAARETRDAYRENQDALVKIKKVRVPKRVESSTFIRPVV